MPKKGGRERAHLPMLWLATIPLLLLLLLLL